MAEVLVHPDGGVVLSNSVVVRSNPWLGLWNDASAAAGVEVRDLSLGHVLARSRPLGVHLQWPERVLAPAKTREAARRTARLLALCLALRLRGARVLLTAHNVSAHDSSHPRLEGVLWSALSLLVTDVHAMSAAGRPELVARHPRLARRRWHVIPHGHYGPVVGEEREQRAARLTLDPPLADSAAVFTSVGALLPYKGVGELVQAFRDLDHDSAVLLLAGRVGAQDAEALAAASSGDPRIHLSARAVGDEELLQRIAASDVVVLPYRRVLNSGSAFLALTAGRPVLVPNTPTFAELSQRVGPGWVRCFRGALSAEHLADAAAADAPPDPPDLSWCKWSDISNSIAEMWRQQ